MQNKITEKSAPQAKNKLLHLYYVIGRAGARREKDISWPSSPVGTDSCTAFALSHRTGGGQERQGHQLAVVAYRDGQLYCICTEP